MPVYHRTQRLQIFGEKPEIQKLYGGRYRMVVRCVAKNDTKAWYDDNKAQIFADFGSLYSAQMSVDGIDARTGEAYDDMVLVKNEATYTRSGEYVIIFTYETLTDSFVQETEDKVDFDLNGLKRLTRTIIAKDTVAYDSVVGTTTILNSSPLLTLAQVSENQLEASEDGFKRIQEVWLESGTLSETLDNVGSQKAKVIETIGSDPATPAGYSLASKQESDFEGFQTNRFTFLKNNVILSRSEDKVGSQEAITTQVFNPTSDPTESGYSLAREEVSDVDGIPTKRYTFLKDNTVLSESEDKVGSQAAIVQEVFNGDPSTPSGYSIANTQESDVDGIPTKRYTFLKDGVILSESEDEVGSQNAIVQEVFNGTPETPGGHIVANKQESDVDGIPTKRYTFLKPSVLSRAIETRNNGNLEIETVEAFSLTPNNTIGGTLISERKSDVEGIPTKQYVYALGFGEIERSIESRSKGKLTITTVTSLGIAGSATGVEIEATTREEDGYKLFRNVFADGVGEVSRNVETRNNGALTITTVESLGTAGAATGVEIEATTSEQDGYTLFRNVFAEGNGEVYRTTETRNQGKLTVTTVEALGNPGSAAGVEIEATTREQDGYTLYRNVFADGQGEVSRTTETRNQGKLIVTTVEALGSAGSAGGVEIEATTREQDGYTLYRNVFAEGQGEVSRSVETRNKGALIITTVEALGTVGSATGVEIESTIREQDGYTLFRNTFAEGVGEVSKTIETRNKGALKITTVESLGTAGSGAGVEIEATTREQDGYTLFRNVFADGQGEVSRTVETRNKGALKITTVESLGSASSAAGIEIEATTREQDGYTLFRNVFADGQGEVSRTEEKRNQGKLTITMVESLDSAGTATGVEIEATTREQDGYTLYRNVFADGQGEVSRTTETRNKGALKITTVESLGSPGTGTGIEIEATTREQDGYTLYRNVFADGQGEVSRTTEKRNQGALTITSVTSLGTISSEDGTEIRSTSREQDGYTIYERVTAEGDGQVFVSQTAGPNNIPGTTRRTIRAYGAELIPAGVLIESQDIERDGFVEYVRTTLDGTIEGIKQTYRDVVEVDVPGTVNCTTVDVVSGTSSGTIAVPTVIPRRSKQVAATVTVEIVTTPTNTATLAYNLGDISCSVTSTQASERLGPGATVIVGSETNTASATGSVRSFSSSARIQTYPGCYLQSTSSTGSVNYVAVRTPVANGNVISYNDTDSSTSSKCIGTGSTSPEGYNTTGILKRNSRPILTALDGAKYYEQITWSV